MNNSLRNLLLLIVVLLTLSFTISTKVSQTIDKSNITAGKLAPDFSFNDQNDNVVKFHELKGKYTYINIWTTRSKLSKKELPHLNNLIAEFGDQIQFVNISVDYQRDKNTWKTEVTNNKLDGIQLIADKGWNSDFVKTYDIVKIPRGILIDDHGKIVDAFAPKPSNPELKRILNNIN